MSVIIIVLIVVGILFLFNNRSNDAAVATLNANVSNLAYCTDEQVKPCVVSFGLNADNNMLVNLLLPDLSFPNFYLKITRGENNILYECQRIAVSPNNAYCIGENVPPGEVLQMMLISTEDNTLLAEGNLSIIGLVFPTLETVILTAMPTTSPESTPTDFFDFILPTATQFDFPLPTETLPAYPNPSYP